jgi:lysophospholipase L1-like esterase
MFLERRLRHERHFKILIVAATSLIIAVVGRSMPWGRYLTATFAASARDAARRTIGIQASRAEVDEFWRRYRRLGIETVQGRVERFYAKADPAYQRFLRYAGMDPEHMLLRWGNYNWTLLLSSRVFEADDCGRSYRFKPNTPSVWLLNPPRGTDGPMFFQVPDGPGLAAAIEGLGCWPLASSRQTTNSWGTRGPEPDPSAAVRGIVLGDSFMQGMFIGDTETPPECLRRYMQDHLKTTVSVLNTGVLGYSPEQYYATLVAFADRFRPHFVVISVYVNDFGYMGDVGNKGIGDWTEGKYWLDKIVAYCDARKWPYLLVPAPDSSHLLLKRNSGYYPGTLTNILDIDSLKYLYPIEDFADAQLKFAKEAKREGRTLRDSPLFNAAIGDTHFSAAGAEVWAQPVGRRIILLLEQTTPGTVGKS